MLTIDLPKEIENFIISEASKENISHSELIQRAFAHLALEKRIQNYKNDIELIKQGKMKMLSAEEVFGNVRHLSPMRFCMRFWRISRPIALLDSTN